MGESHHSDSKITVTVGEESWGSVQICKFTGQFSGVMVNWEDQDHCQVFSQPSLRIVLPLKRILSMQEVSKVQNELKWQH